MIHFPSTYHSQNTSSALPSRTDSLKLNATQQKAATHQIFTTVEEELHDARRVHSHGQEDDLRAALGMVVERLGEVSTMLSDAYKTSAELEVQLNVAKSNLALVIANNEMLEDALKQRDSTTQNVGWRRTSGRAYSTDDALNSATIASPHPGGDNTPTATPIDSPAQESSRFFKFRFTPGSSSISSRPGTPGASPAAAHLNSPSLPALGVVKEKEREREKELEKELEKERKAREEAKKEKEALEEELESLSQALFEEANKMVATERIRRADVEEELREAKLEKDALRSALRLLEGQASASASPSLPSAPIPSAPFSLAAIPSPSPSPTLTLSPTSVTELEKEKEPAPQELPPSLSSSSTARPSIPPPAPLLVPTTPFDYDATFDPTSATPTQRAGVKVEHSPEQDEEPVSVSETEETKELSEVEAALLPSPSPQSEESKQSQTAVDSGKSTGTSALPSSKPEEDAEVEREILKQVQAIADLEAETAKDSDKHRPSSLHLLSLEQDPWADAPSLASGGMVGSTV
ncbi:hypothetical protein C0991_000365 [Blastosporella zonata]|nr:hypothetical protein C0991_000365 [Blastosporella zonata]